MATFEDVNNIPSNQPSLLSEIDKQYIQQVTPKGYEQDLINAYNLSMQPEEIGAQDRVDLYPGIDQPINVGGISTQTFGSGSIYVPTGNLLAINPMLERRRALDIAAKKRAAEIKPWERPKAPEFKDPYWNKQLYGVVESGLNNVWQEAVNEYGPANARIILQDPNTSYGQRVAKIMNNAEYLTKNVNEITTLIAELDKGIQDKTIYLTPEKKKLYEQYKQKLGNFEDINTLQESNLPQVTRQLMGIRDLNDYLNTSKVMDKLEAQIKSTFGVSDQGDYFRVVEKEEKNWQPIIEDLSRELSETTFSGEYTQQEIKEALSARLKNQVKKSGSIEQKTEATRNAEEGGNIEDPNAPGLFTTYTTPNKTLHNFDVIASYNMNYTGKPKELTVIGADGNVQKVNVNGMDVSNLKVLTPDGKTTFIEGNSRIQLGRSETLKSGRVVQNVKVYKPKEMYIDSNGEITDKKTGTKVQTWEVSDELVEIKTPEGKGTNMYSQFVTQIKDQKMKKNYEAGIEKLSGVKPSTQNNVQQDTYTIKGKKYTLKQLQDMGYSESDVAPYKD